MSNDESGLTDDLAVELTAGDPQPEPAPEPDEPETDE